MAHAEAKKRRCVLAVKNRAEGHSLSKAFRLISDRENISVKTISHWWYEAQKEQEKARTTEENEKVDRPASVVEAPLPYKEPVLPHVVTDTGCPHCSRCKSKNIEERQEGLWVCEVCGARLAWDDPGDVEIKYRGGSGRHYGRFGWMA